MNFNNTYAKSMKKQLDHGRRAQFSMLIKARNFDLPIDIQTKPFESIVCPILLYGLQTTHPTRGVAVTPGWQTLCKLCRPLHAIPQDGWQSSSKKRAISRLIQVRLLHATSLDLQYLSQTNTS